MILYLYLSLKFIFLTYDKSIKFDEKTLLDF